MPYAKEAQDLFHLGGRHLVLIGQRGNRPTLQEVLDPELAILGRERVGSVEQGQGDGAAKSPRNALHTPRDRPGRLTERPRDLTKRQPVLYREFHQRAVGRQQMNGPAKDSRLIGWHRTPLGFLELIQCCIREKPHTPFLPARRV
ncbi:MAG TPA: hypothetical protein VL282_18520 [Tepidisphaeraceae bacterium]|jgi:hypothetical protein|nr:hypothetical protein [Tepidisphaeraceae bacterium]